MRADLARQRAALDKQDAELAIAEKVLSEIEGSDAPPAPAQNAMLNMMAAHGLSRRDRVVEALSGKLLWMTSAEINDAIAKRQGARIKNTSFYPMLTVLKNEGVVVRDGDKMALKSRIGEGSQVND